MFHFGLFRPDSNRLNPNWGLTAMNFIFWGIFLIASKYKMASPPFGGTNFRGASSTFVFPDPVT